MNGIANGSVNGSMNGRGPQPIMYLKMQTASFSGATLISLLLGAHPEITTVGEMNGLRDVDVDTYLCSCGEKIVECDFWQSVTEQMKEKGFDFDVAHFDTRFVFDDNPLVHALQQRSFGNETIDALRDSLILRWPKEYHRIKALVERNEALIKTILQKTGNRVFVDTSKEAIRLRSFRQFSEFDIRVIHLVRDVRGFTASMVRRRGDDQLANAVKRWKRFHKKTLRMLERQPEQKQLRVRYEDLCSDPKAFLRRIYQFCEVDPSINIENFQDVPQHVIGNPTRLRSQSEIRLDERWRKTLTQDQLHFIDKQAGDLNRYFGYED